MSKRKKHEQREGTCVYCGKDGPITREHVFAERLFEVLDPQMVTVPACEPCNTKKELGDKDLDIYITGHIGGSQHPDAVAHARRIIEHANNRTKRWLRKSLREATPVDLVTDEGIVVDQAIEFPFNDERIIKALEMSIRGLHYYETETMLPVGYPVFVREISWSEAVTYVTELSKLVPVTPTVKGNHVVWWQSFGVSDMPLETKSWIICFNNWVVYDGSTGELAVRLRDQLDEFVAANADRRAFEESIRVGPRKVKVPRAPDGRLLLPPRD